MITLKNITIRRGVNDLLTNVDWVIYPMQRIGIVGSNGTGKTTLFSLLLGNLQPEKGDLDIAKHVRIAHMAQETPALAISALDFALSGDAELEQLQQELRVAEGAEDGHALANLYEKVGIIDGFTAPARAAQLLVGLGFQQHELEKPVSSFSGGWRVRLNLAKALMSRSDVLLLDEPTNHLDLDAVLWLEEWLRGYQGTLLLISHDRDFLDRTVNHIAHLYHQKLKVYAGNYTTFETQRANDLMLQQAMYEKQQKKIAHLQSFVNRFKAKASKAKQAQSRVKAIERMDLVAAVQAESEFQFEFRQPDYTPNPMLTLDYARAGYGDHVVLDKLSISITPKDRIGILGPNGAGKSTLIKLLAGEIDVMMGGKEKASGLKIGYFAQHQVDHLHLDETPLWHLREIAPKQAETELRTYLGSFGFLGDRVFDRVGNFSGGEKSRLALALIVWQQPNLLLLDEPTNHLDLEMRNALSIALQEYEGAMLLVSHDRFLVRTTTDQLYLVANNRLQTFDGDLSDYQTWLFDYRKQQANALKEATPKAPVEKKEQVSNSSATALQKKISKMEEELAKLNNKLTGVELQLGDTTLYENTNKEKLDKLLSEQTTLKTTIESKEQVWLNACEERDNLMG